MRRSIQWAGLTIAGVLATGGPALADAAPEPEDYARIAEYALAQRGVACGGVVEAAALPEAERIRLSELGYRWRFLARCANGDRVIVGTNLRRDLRGTRPAQYVRVLPRRR